MTIQFSHSTVEYIAVNNFPIINPGDDISRILLDCIEKEGISFCDNDVLIIAQKVISKAENRYIILNNVTPTKKAYELAQICRKDPRLVELIMQESAKVLRVAPNVLIVQHRLGFVLANAGIDQSNVENGDMQVLLLPEDPDSSALRLKQEIFNKTGKSVGVVINDSFGRAWRLGTCGICIGCAGLTALKNYRGCDDIFGRKLHITEVAWGDEIAAAGSLLMGAANERRPVVLVKGLSIGGEGSSRDLLRPENMDVFR